MATHHKKLVVDAIKASGLFLLHTFFGIALFLLVAIPAVGIYLVGDYVLENHAPDLLAQIFHLLSGLIFFIDLACAAFYLVVQAVIYIREIRRLLNAPSLETRS